MWWRKGLFTRSANAQAVVLMRFNQPTQDVMQALPMPHMRYASAAS